MSPEILAPPTPAAVRDELQDLVVRELLGPAGGPEEEVDEPRVSERYLVGTLAPAVQRQVVIEDLDDLGTDEGTSSEEGPGERTAPPPVRTTLFPSSIGLTFCVDSSCTGLRITARWGHYLRAKGSLVKTDAGNPKTIWKRRQVEGLRILKPLQGDSIPELPVHDDHPLVKVRGRARQHGDTWVVTLFLINLQEEPATERDRTWIFQPELVVEDVLGGPVFRSRPEAVGSDGEAAMMSMLYRRHLEFASGHGVAVHAEPSDADPTKAIRVQARVVPACEVPRTVPPPMPGVTLDMSILATAPDLRPHLAPLAEGYERWLADQRGRLQEPDLMPHLTAAHTALLNCEATLGRIRAGIELVCSDVQAEKAFRFMNRAMASQRVRGLFTERVRRGEKPDIQVLDVPDSRSWYPFQIAFILLNLPSLGSLSHPDRAATADLLWFPTGGGKTEAYLGLAAFTFAIRRLQGTVEGRSGEHDLAVLMRYTLRLLTLQQFQRAATLLCAAEVLRREDETTWGKTPFRLGLWVGQKTTPNTTEDSDEAIKSGRGLMGGSPLGSPAQLTNCPWCGERIDAGRDIQVQKPSQGLGRTFIRCGDPRGACPFTGARSKGEGLPVLVVDDEIYRHPPSMLIATVDKFAQMPWKSDIQLLFGQTDTCCERHGFRSQDSDDPASHPAKGSLPKATSVPHPLLRPPDLIIQDELHLISGPLGSLVGLYETAVDRLATWQVDGHTVRPKVVASTATIKRAADQVWALFVRDVQVFPPSGLDVEDNFFAVQEPVTEKPGRRYVGICAPGRRLKEVLVRVYVAHLAAAQTLLDKYRDATLVDPWMTLVGYFNSLRELGGTRRLVLDDVQSRLRNTDQRGLSKRLLNSEGVEELTSRKTSSDIPYILDRLETPCPQPGTKPVKFLDVLLATNMISVGVDVKRLGLMVTAGHPKNTAEYIQATSRVGRTWPGLVCSVYNWSRPRDLSYYERFEHYHSTFYKSVEPLSVTPFAPRALDRALTGVLVSLIRLQGKEFSRNDRAEVVQVSHPYVTQAIEALAARALQVTGSKEAADLVRLELQNRLKEWMLQAQGKASGRRLGYRTARDGVTLGLLQAPGSLPWDTFTCLLSLRDVEPTANLVLEDFGLDDGPAIAVSAESEEVKS